MSQEKKKNRAGTKKKKISFSFFDFFFHFGRTGVFETTVVYNLKE